MKVGTVRLTRDEFIAAAPRIFARVPPAQLEVAQVLRMTGCNEVEFKGLFDGAGTFLAAVQLAFFEGRLARALESVGGVPPGMERIFRSFSSYLDYTLENAVVFRWLLEAQERYPDLREGFASRNQGTTTMMAIEFKTLDWPYPQDVARLAMAMMFEISCAEAEVGKQVSGLRNSLWCCLRALGSRPPF